MRGACVTTAEGLENLLYIIKSYMHKSSDGVPSVILIKFRREVTLAYSLYSHFTLYQGEELNLLVIEYTDC